MARDDDQTWAELVESYHSTDSDAAQWPAAEDIDPDSDSDDAEDGPSSVSTTRPAHAGPASFTHSVTGPSEGAHRDQVGDDDHFVPPAPPPLPRTDLITWLAWAGALGTPVLFITLGLLGKSLSGLASLAAASAFIGGFALLIARLRGHDPYDPDNGAVV